MTTMYRVRDRWGSFEFVKVEVDKVTNSTVTIKGQRALKCSDGTWYFDSFDDAQQYAKNLLQLHCDQAERLLMTAKSNLQEVTSVTEDTIATSHSRW